MGKVNLCFVVEQELLFLEEVLIEYNKVPVLFVCKDKLGNFYVAYEVDSDIFLVIKTDRNELIHLLEQKITLREIFTNKNNCYQVITSKKGPHEDQVNLLPMEIFNLDVLPEDLPFTVIEQKHKDFLQSLCSGQEFTKKDLESWDIVELRDGSFYYVSLDKGALISNKEFLRLDMFFNNLENEELENLNIVKVYRRWDDVLCISDIALPNSLQYCIFTRA